MMPSTNLASAVAAANQTAPLSQLQQVLLSQLAGDADGVAGPSMPDLLEQALGDNPLAAPLAAAMRKRQQLSEAEVYDEAEETEEDSTAADVLRRLYEEVEVLRARNDQLAHALGACPRCWGEDVSCPRCQGRGHPGGRLPDAGLFVSFVAPAIRRRRFDRTQPGSEHRDAEHLTRSS
jgi:hypothetical protein